MPIHFVAHAMPIVTPHSPSGISERLNACADVQRIWK